MESMGKKPRRRRAFTAEFKAEIVELTSCPPANIRPGASAERAWPENRDKSDIKRRPGAHEAPGHPVCAARDLNPEPAD
jgi:hypothetical protein